MAASKKKSAANLEGMDAMFGVDIVPLGSASLSVRRVLSREQQKIAGSVVGSVQQGQLDMSKVISKPVPDEDGNTPEPLSEDEMMAAVEKIEETMHADLLRGVDAYLTNRTALDLDDWGTPALSQLFFTLQRHSATAISKAVGQHFPTNGPTE